MGQLARELPISRPAVSQPPKVLKDVVDRQAGTRRVYQVDPEAVAALREYSDASWGQALASFHRAAETPDDHHGEETP